MPLEVPVKQTGFEASLEAAAKKAGRSLSINMGKSSKTYASPTMAIHS